MAGAREIVVRIVGDNSKLNRALDDSDSRLSGFGRTALKVGGILAGGFVATQAIDFLHNAANAAAEDEKQQAILAQTLTNVTGATREQIRATEEWVTKQQFATGFSDSELRPALQNLVVATGDLTAAQALMGTAMDISTAKGIPLETVSLALMKAYQGNEGALSRLGIVITDTEGRTMSFDEIMQNANKTFGGATQEAAETSAGKLKIMQEKFGELTEEIGTAVLPIMEKFVDFSIEHIIPVIEDVIALLTGAPSDIGDALAGILNNLSSMFAATVNFLIDKANAAIDIVDALTPGSMENIEHVTANTYSLGPKSWLANATDAEKAAFGAYVSGTNPAFVGPSRGQVEHIPTAGEPGFTGPTKQQAASTLTAAEVDRLAEAMGAPKLAGGGYVDRSGFAVVHQGEMVTRAGTGTTINIGTLVSSAPNVEALIADINNYARRNGGLRVPGGVVAVS